MPDQTKGCFFYRIIDKTSDTVHVDASVLPTHADETILEIKFWQGSVALIGQTKDFTIEAVSSGSAGIPETTKRKSDMAPITVDHLCHSGQ